MFDSWRDFGVEKKNAVELEIICTDKTKTTFEKSER